MSGRQLLTAVVVFVFASAFFLPASAAAERKILYVDSYHASYPWSAGITRGIEKVLAGDTEIELRIFRMDTKRQPSEEHKISAAREAKGLIDSWHPDLVIASDDNASKYLIVPYFKGSSLPFVFCGVNWDASDYGFPWPNVTGMIEVQLIDQILDTLEKYAAGRRIAFIKGDDFSARKEADLFEKRFKIKLDKRFVSDFAAWKEQYRKLQHDADLLLLGNSVSIKDWDAAAAKAFILETTRIPSGNWDDWMAPFSLVTFANDPEEQGEWAARTALKVLAGTPPSAIPIVTNQRAKIFLNMELARKLGIKFPIELIERATFTSEMGGQ